MTAHIYSSTPNTSRAVDPGSSGVDAARYNDPTYSLYYNGFVVATTPFITPLGFYLAPVPGNPTSQVDIWIHSPKWHGQPLVQVVQTAGSFTKSSANSALMPLNGYIKLDMYVNTLTQIYNNLDNSQWWSSPIY